MVNLPANKSEHILHRKLGISSCSPLPPNATPLNTKFSPIHINIKVVTSDFDERCSVNIPKASCDVGDRRKQLYTHSFHHQAVAAGYYSYKFLNIYCLSADGVSTPEYTASSDSMNNPYRGILEGLTKNTKPLSEDRWFPTLDSKQPHPEYKLNGVISTLTCFLT